MSPPRSQSMIPFTPHAYKEESGTFNSFHPPKPPRSRYDFVVVEFNYNNSILLPEIGNEKKACASGLKKLPTTVQLKPRYSFMHLMDFNSSYSRQHFIEQHEKTDHNDDDDETAFHDSLPTTRYNAIATTEFSESSPSSVKNPPPESSSSPLSSCSISLNGDEVQKEKQQPKRNFAEVGDSCCESASSSCCTTPPATSKNCDPRPRKKAALAA